MQKIYKIYIGSTQSYFISKINLKALHFNAKS